MLQIDWAPVVSIGCRHEMMTSWHRNTFCVTGDRWPVDYSRKGPVMQNRHVASLQWFYGIPRLLRLICTLHFLATECLPGLCYSHFGSTIYMLYWNLLETINVVIFKDTIRPPCCICQDIFAITTWAKLRAYWNIIRQVRSKCVHKLWIMSSWTVREMCLALASVCQNIMVHTRYWWQQNIDGFFTIFSGIVWTNSLYLVVMNWLSACITARYRFELKSLFLRFNNYCYYFWTRACISSCYSWFGLCVPLWFCPYQSYIFVCKVNISHAKYAEATSFIFDFRTDVLVKLSYILRQKMLRPEEDSNP